MGYVLFESSGTFNPSTYGLVPGDTVQVIAVGGGGGGCGANGAQYNATSSRSRNGGTAGAAGGASSFGNILSAAGGSGGTCCTGTGYSPALTMPSPPATGTTGIGIEQSYTSSFTYNGTSIIVCMGADGGNGWFPDRVPQRVDYISLYAMLGNSFARNGVIQFQEHPIQLQYVATTGNTVRQASWTAQSAARTDKCGGISTCSYWGSSPGFVISGIPGIGYGAGGASAVGCSQYNNTYGMDYQLFGYGGNGGVVATTTYVLPNTNAIAVTVGNGGAGVSVNKALAGGGGARGCVAVFW